ncbi:MAG: hypothetical protein ACLQBA_18440 [Candidatus Binataceae bacterium]
MRRVAISKNYASVVIAIVLSSLLSACSAHNPFIITNTTQSSIVGSTMYPPYEGRVLVTQQALPPDVEFTLIGTIDVGKVWYGSSSNVLSSMADRARELGANAVVQVRTWHQPSGFSWAAPHGSGQAVLIKDINALGSSGVTGDWY